MTHIRQDVHDEIDRLPDKQLAGVKEFLTCYPSRLHAALRNAPESDEPETEEEARLVAEAKEWLRQNGGRGIPHEEIKREFRIE